MDAGTFHWQRQKLLKKNARDPQKYTWKYLCKLEIKEVQCKIPYCFTPAVICWDHKDKDNARRELLQWLKAKNIPSKVTTLRSPLVSTKIHKCVENDFPVTIRKEERESLQRGDMSCLFSNEQLTKLFKKDLKQEGVKNAKLSAVPEGEVSFIFCKMMGKESEIQAFIDPGCNCAVMRDGIPQRELKSVKLRDGPIPIDVATGISVNAKAEWASVLPLRDGSYQVIRGLTVEKVTSDMPKLKLQPVLKAIQRKHQKEKILQKIQIPETLGGEVDLILGIQFVKIHPKAIFSLDNGLTVYRSQFSPANPDEIGCIGGPIDVLESIVSDIGPRSAVRYMGHLIRNISAGFTPRIDFFPDSTLEMNRCLEEYADKNIPQLDEYLEQELNEDNIEEPQENKLEMESPLVNCEDCLDCNKYMQAHTIQSEFQKFMQHQEAGLDTTFRCRRCRDCKLCLKGAGEERKSMTQEAHQELIRESVSIDKEKGRAVAKLPFLEDPKGKLTPNAYSALKRLDNVCKKYSSNKEVLTMVNAAFNKLFKNGHIILLSDLNRDLQEKLENAWPSYYIPWDIAFNETSISTPARPVFDASARTPGGESLNNLLPKGIPNIVRLLDMVLGWKMGPSAFTGDIRQFYNTILLHENFWQYQKIMYRENLDPKAETVTAIIKTLIYGVRPVGSQCEEVMKLLADEIWEEYPEVATLLVLKRYVDDFGHSTQSREATDLLISQTTDVLGTISMKLKGWTISGQPPPDNVTEDGVSVGFGGKTWFPEGDFYKLNIQSLHFAKKRRGRLPPDLIKFDQTSGLSIDEFTPPEITRTNCTSVTARIYDTEGLLTPITLKLKNDLRKLITYEPSWTKPIPDHQRAIWINNFKTIEEVRDIMYLRCVIPSDANSTKARLLFVCDAAEVGIVLGAYVGYERQDGSWSCDLLFGKGLLAPENWTIPQKELHALSGLSNLKVVLENAIGTWLDGIYAFSDSEIALCWSIYETVKLSTMVRNRVINIRSKMGLDILHHVEGKHNPCDVGIRPENVTADSVRPGSVWMSGKDWMKLSISKAQEIGVIKTVQDIKLTNEKKKVFKEGIVFDTFETADENIFAIHKVNKIKINSPKVQERQSKADYLYSPLLRSFKSCVRITALVLVAVSKFKRLTLIKQIERQERPTSALKLLDFPEAKFSVFNGQVLHLKEQTTPSYIGTTLRVYFSVQGVRVASSYVGDERVKSIRLTEKQLSAALDYLFKKASIELTTFNKEKEIKKIALEQDGVWYCKTRLLECEELKAVGHISEFINIEQFTGVNFKVPVLDQHSPLAISIALHLHYVKFPHRGAETLYRASLQYCRILNGRNIFNAISIDCIYCKKLRKKLLDQVMGPLAECQVTFSPMFYFTLVDLWGPLTAYAPGYEKVTRGSNSKPYNFYFMIFACCTTGTVNCQVIEGKDTSHCLDGFNKFFCETTVPKIVYPDQEGGLIKALRDGEVDLVDLSGTLSRQKGVMFVDVVPQGHSAHGRIEKRIHMLQQTLEKSEMRNSRTTVAGWQTLAKIIEREVNSVPLGYYHHSPGAQNLLLRVLTPNSLRLITAGDRAPAGLFTIPESANDLMDKIKEKYNMWYQVWSECYLPLISDRAKWHLAQENLQAGDVVYFKLTESKMSVNWRLGKVELVKIGRDGCVREATIGYKDVSSDDPDDWLHRTVDRPVRNIVKLFHIDDTCLMDDIKDVHDVAKKILDQENANSGVSIDTEAPSLSFDTEEKVPSIKKPRKKRRTELENLEIDMTGWNKLVDSPLHSTPCTAVSPDLTPDQFQAWQIYSEPSKPSPFGYTLTSKDIEDLCVACNGSTMDQFTRDLGGLSAAVFNMVGYVEREGGGQEGGGEGQYRVFHAREGEQGGGVTAQDDIFDFTCDYDFDNDSQLYLL